jgi:superfamily II DNA or RNA helicase
MKLLDPQIPHAYTLLNSLYLNGIAADLSETGCGKTYVATYVAKSMNVPVVVICPKAVIPVWKRVMADAGIAPSVIMNYEKLMRGNTKYLSYDEVKMKQHNTATWQCMDIKLPLNCLIILDEVHKCKGSKSLNGAFLTVCKNNGYKLLVMSATAATNPLEMKHFGYAVNLHNWWNFNKWCTGVGADYNAQYGGMAVDMKSAKAQEGMRWVHDQLFNVQCVASRLTRNLMKSMFPDNRVLAECLDMGSNTAKIQAVYEHMEAEIARLDERSKEYRAHVFAEMMKARRMTEILKVPTIVEMVEDLYEEGVSPVVFVNFEDTMVALQKRLESYGDVIGIIKGGQSAKERQTHIDEFQNNTRRIMLVNLAAGNAGISLHDLDGNYPRHSIVCPSFSAINLVQALGRIHRAEGKSPCIQKIVFAADTIEERCCERVQSKLNNLDMLNDGDLVGDIKIW